MNNEKVLKTPADYANYSIRLTSDQQKLVLSIGSGFSAGIKRILSFYQKWHAIDLNLRSDLKISCEEFCEVIKKYIKAQDRKDTGEAAYYKHLLQLHAIYIRRLYHHLDDPGGEFLKQHCFNDIGLYTYLEFFWKKEIPTEPDVKA